MCGASLRTSSSSVLKLIQGTHRPVSTKSPQQLSSLEITPGPGRRQGLACYFSITAIINWHKCNNLKATEIYIQFCRLEVLHGPHWDKIAD